MLFPVSKMLEVILQFAGFNISAAANTNPADVSPSSTEIEYHHQCLQIVPEDGFRS